MKKTWRTKADIRILCEDSKSSHSNGIVWCNLCNSICLLGFNSDFLLGLFNQTCRNPNTIGSPHFRGSLRWLLFNFNDITYHQPICVSVYSFLFRWNIKQKWKSRFAGYQGTFPLSFATRCDWNASGLLCLCLEGYKNQAWCDAIWFVPVYAVLCKRFKPPLIFLYYYFETTHFLVIF